MTDNVDKEDLKARLKARLAMSRIGRFPKDIKEEKVEKLKATVNAALVKSAQQSHGSPIDLSVHTS
jgi:hypothetical protein